jgi:hypothetical protein
MNEDEAPEIEPVDLKLLKRELPPPGNLEERTVAALKERHVLRPAIKRSNARWWQAIAAAIVIFAGGFGLGHRWHPDSTKGQPTFVLLLREEGNVRKAATLGEEQKRVNEYVSWARQLRAGGRFVDGTKLRDGRHDLGAGASAGTGIIGFFAFSARNLDEAMAIARTCPHLRYGGQIEVREVERV